MKETPNAAVLDFFERYPEAEEVHEVATQLFHANAKEGAEARAAFYGCELKTWKKSDVCTPAPEGGSTLEGSTEGGDLQTTKKAKK